MVKTTNLKRITLKKRESLFHKERIAPITLYLKTTLSSVALYKKSDQRDLYIENDILFEEKNLHLQEHINNTFVTVLSTRYPLFRQTIPAGPPFVVSYQLWSPTQPYPNVTVWLCSVMHTAKSDSAVSCMQASQTELKGTVSRDFWIQCFFLILQ